MLGPFLDLGQELQARCAREPLRREAAEGR
jgi:hypothetical protein